jgi:hypothetical protein
MIMIHRKFVNENGNEISMEVVHDARGVTVTAQGPDSQVEHIWTPVEASTLRELLGLLEPAFKIGYPA